MWCPVFLQTEDKVGVSALTESWTCFRPYTDHTHTHTHKMNKQPLHAYTLHIEPCTPDTKYTTWLSIMYLLVKELE